MKTAIAACHSQLLLPQQFLVLSQPSRQRNFARNCNVPLTAAPNAAAPRLQLTKVPLLSLRYQV
jgi:hypothetical protein